MTKITALHSYTYLSGHDVVIWSPGHSCKASVEKHHFSFLGAIWFPWKSEDGDAQEVNSAFFNLTMTWNWNMTRMYMTRTAELNIAVVKQFWVTSVWKFNFEKIIQIWPGFSNSAVNFVLLRVFVLKYSHCVSAINYCHRDLPRS